MTKEGQKAKTETEAAQLDGLRRESTMNQTRLIQRLEIPREKEHDNPFAFGADLKRGGFKKKTYAMLSKIFVFDYMGAAEYKWGAVPESLGKIWDYGTQKELTAGVLNLEEGAVFYICNRRIEKETRTVIKRIAHGGIRTRDYVGLREAVKNRDRRPGDLAGWIELDNSFMFFVDKPMFEKSAKLFGMELSAPKPADKHLLR